jgi:hypothetical protein
MEAYTNKYFAQNSTPALKYGEIRNPYQSELDYFSKNPHVSGMSTEDYSVIFNPNSYLTSTEKESVLLNERARIYMKVHKINPDFELTPEQIKRFKNYSEDTNDIRSTIAARIISGDPSVGEPTDEQINFSKKLRQMLLENWGY